MKKFTHCLKLWTVGALAFCAAAAFSTTLSQQRAAVASPVELCDVVAPPVRAFGGSVPNVGPNSRRNIDKVREVKKIDPTTKSVPFEGLAAKSAEEQDKATAGLSPAEALKAGKELQNARMDRDALVLFKKAASSEATDEEYVEALGDYVGLAVQFARRNTGEISFAAVHKTIEEALSARPDSWFVKTRVVGMLNNLPQFGYLENGEFVYSDEWRENRLSVADRTRTRILQVYAEALPLVREEGKRLLDYYAEHEKDGTRFFDNMPYELEKIRERIFSYYNMFRRTFNLGASDEYWRLQKLTDLSTLPDYIPSEYFDRGSRFEGAPVDAEGAPVFYAIPESFETAKNDGERYQALLEELLLYDRTLNAYRNVNRERASEARQLFGVQTLNRYHYFFNEDADTPAESSEEGVWSLNTLKDSETIAKLSSGVKRFELPDHYNYLTLLHNLLETEDYTVLPQIAEEYQNRRQLDKAADVWKIAIEKGWPGLQEQAKEALSQIVDPRVCIDSGSSVRGMDVDLSVRYRNAKGVKVVVKPLNVDEILAKIRDKSFWKKSNGINFETALRFAIMKENGLNTPYGDEFALKGKVIGEEVASYETALEPDPAHYDRVARLDFPSQKPGPYLIEVEAIGGNKDYAIVWLQDLAIVNKPFLEDSAKSEAKPRSDSQRARVGLDVGNRYFVLDSKTGEPKPNETVEFFFVTRRWNDGKQAVETKNATLTTDENGSVFIGREYVVENGNTEVLEVLTVVPRKGKGGANQFGLMDMRGLWRMSAYGDSFSRVQAYFVSDRPIYRPEQTAKFKFIVGTAQYDAPENNLWSGREVRYTITSPAGEEVVSKNVTLDQYGSFSDEYQLPGDAKLGVYSVLLTTGDLRQHLGGGAFRLEEYRKPEFQVTVDAPKDPVALGDSFKAKVNAKYYFGAPVTNADVSYTVTRTNYRSKFFPARYWDWFYGCGYWQFTYDCEWYPGWFRWGCARIAPFFGGHERGVPEVVASGDARIDAEGNFEIEIDTSLAKTIYPNDDQQYEISVEVTDQSRRTIAGSGKVYAAREPFKTYVWFDRGFFRVGDKMEFNFQARRLDGKSVDGAAVVKLYKIAYEPTDDGSVKPVEKEVFTQELKTDSNGKGSVSLTASDAGQYRASCVVTTETGVSEEGAQLIVVHGASKSADAAADYRFGALEIVPDKPEYSVGDVAHIQLSSNYKDAYVLWTARPINGISTEDPRFVKLENGIAYVDVPIERADQPNIFIQATTVFDGRLYQEQRELAVPPEKHVLDVAVEPSAERVKPGEKAKVKLRLTDPDGKPVVGQTVVTVYDKALDALAGGSNVGDIRKFFWNWRREGGPSGTSNLDASYFRNVFSLFCANPTGKETSMLPIGVFGNVQAFGGSGLKGRMGGGMGAMNGMTLGLAEAAPTAMRSRSAMRKEAVMADAALEVAEEEAMDMAAPAMAAAPMEAKAMGASMDGGMDMAADDSAEEQAPMVEATVRKNLADAAYWNADLQPGDDGVIEIEVDMPENLTTWKICAWSVGDGLRVGSGESEIVTSKDLIVRMQKPRFLTQNDQAVFTANVHNYLDMRLSVLVQLDVDGPVKLADGSEPIRTVDVPANGEARVDWTVDAVGVGTSTVVMKALTSKESDAIEETIEVKEHGILKQIPISGVIPAIEKDAQESDEQADASQVRETSFTLTVPERRREESTNLVVRFSPTLAGAIFDAIPYLTQYPYGCTEQTLNKFLPMVLAQKALQDSGVDLASLATKRANLNAQEVGDAQQRAKQWQKDTRVEPVFDVEKARAMTAEGVAKLQSMQCGDGGWGWFSGAGEISTPYLTALVARGLVLAQKCDQRVNPNVIARATAWLVNYEREQATRVIRGKVWTDEQKRNFGWQGYKESADSTDAAVYAALAELGVQPSGFDEKYVDYDKAEIAPEFVGNQFAVHAVMKELLWEARTELALYPLASFAIALTEEPQSADLATRVETLLRILSQYRQVDDENQTAWLALDRFNGWCFWNWYGGEFETQAYYLRLLQRVDVETLKKLGLEQDASRMVKYLLNNRKNATYWNSTRDTALCVEAFVEYLQKTHELAPRAKVEVLVDGELKKVVEYTPENLFETDGTLELGPGELSAGDHTVALRVNGDAPLYYNAYLEYFTLEDPISKAGLELKTERRYYKLVERENASATVEGGHGQVVDQRVEIYDRSPLSSGDAVKSGEIVEVELIVDSKNDYESVLLEDLKPAGFEAVESVSGYNGNALGAYVEYRDDRVCFFCSRLPQGRSVVKYQLRAETPGKFAALPAKIWAMYAPELKGNADEFKTKVDDRF